MRAKRNVTRDLIASTRVDEDLYRGSLALTELWKDERGRKREKREKRKERKGREKKRNCGRERKGGKRQEEVLALGTTRPVSKTRRAKPEGKGGRETLLPKIYGATGNTRTLLVTSWCTPRALTVLYIYISYDTKTSRYFHLPSSRTRCLCPVHRSPVSFLCFPPADEARKLPGGMWPPPPLCPRLPTLLLDLLLFVVPSTPRILDECTSPRCTCVRPSSSPSSSSINENYAFAVETISEIRRCVPVWQRRIFLIFFF